MRALLGKLDVKNLNQRMLSALLLMPVVLGVVWFGGWLYRLLIIMAMLIGMYEWLHLTAKKTTPQLDMMGLLGLLGALVVGWGFGYLWGLQLAILVSLAFFYFAQEADPGEKWLEKALWVAAGLPYLAFGGLALMYLRGTGPLGLYFTLYMLAVVWGTDSGAFFAGRFIGGPKLCPKISPNKTWAGLFGGMVLAGALGYAVARGFGDLDPWPETWVAMGLAIIAQAGDFFESYVKRRAGAKDSGTLIPGHGGLLDRIDGLLFVAVAIVALKFMMGG